MTRKRREDGAQMRRKVLEAAGEIFAEKGVDRTTGKEIAERAGTNSASVNYYFGGIAGLYEEVLVEAHQRLISIERLTTVEQMPLPSRQKLEMILQSILARLIQEEDEKWVIKVVVREVMNPSPAMEVLRQRGILPKKQILTHIIADYLDIAPDDTLTTAALIGTIGPFLLLLIGEKTVLPTIFPQVFGAGRDPTVIAEGLTTFLFGGLDAVAARHRSAQRLT